MADLILGPLLRYAGTSEATVWVETDRPCEVEVRPEGAPAASDRTFSVAGHHFAIVRVTGLRADAATPYAVHLDGEPAWPQAGSPFPPSVLRTHAPNRPLRIVWGSCRVAAPHEPPYSLTKDEDPRGREIDSLRALAQDLRDRPAEDLPHLLVLLGDQMYADEVSPETLAFIRSRRDTSEPPGDQVADFEEYTRLYRESWSEPVMRWLLSSVSSAMIFDDHDVHDDWNTSIDWVEEYRAKRWWDARIEGAFMSYLLYQHWGNLAPEALFADEVFQAVREADDPEPLLREFARRADREVEGTRWSYCRDLGTTRLVMIDSRAGRVLTPGHRAMVDAREWQWIADHARGDVDHLLLGTSLPLLLSPGLHHLEAFSEAVGDGAWGRRASRLAEKLRQGLDLEHWAAFRTSFEAMCELLEAVATGRRGTPPATITVLSGDVHHAYVAEVAFPRGAEARSRVWQAVCSPFRNPLDKHERRAIRAGFRRPAALLGRLLCRAAGVPDPPIRWRVSGGLRDGVFFDNQVCTLHLDEHRATLTLDKALPGERKAGDTRLERVFERSL